MKTTSETVTQEVFTYICETCGRRDSRKSAIATCERSHLAETCEHKNLEYSFDLGEDCGTADVQCLDCRKYLMEKTLHDLTDEQEKFICEYLMKTEEGVHD